MRFHGGSSSSVSVLEDNIGFVIRRVVSDMSNVVRDIVNISLQVSWRLSESIFVHDHSL